MHTKFSLGPDKERFCLACRPSLCPLIILEHLELPYLAIMVISSGDLIIQAIKSLVCFVLSSGFGIRGSSISIDDPFLFGDRSSRIGQFSDSSFHISGLFPSNMFITLLTVISIFCTIVIRFCGSLFMSLTAITSLTEVATVTFEK